MPYNAVSKNSHDNCMFIGYTDPNRKLDGSTIIFSSQNTDIDLYM